MSKLKKLVTFKNWERSTKVAVILIVAALVSAR